MLNITPCISAVKIIACLELSKTISFTDGHWIIFITGYIVITSQKRSTYLIAPSVSNIQAVSQRVRVVGKIISAPALPALRCKALD